MPWDMYKANILTPEEVEKFDIELPANWGSRTVNSVFQTLGIRDKGVPAGTGAGLVQSPYLGIYTKAYGVDPIKDLPTYRCMIRTQPDIQQAIDLQVGLAVGKGFVIEHKNPKIKKYFNDFADRINMSQTMFTMGHDMLGYGDSYTEIQWADILETEEEVFKYEDVMITLKEVEKFEINAQAIQTIPSVDTPDGVYRAKIITRKPKVKTYKTTGKMTTMVRGLKPLDPVYMRVRRDSWGNIYGYVQWMTAPPVMLSNENIIHIKFRPKSTGYESAYGTSILMALIKNNELLMQFENDAAIWIHSRAVPPLIVKGGTPEKPYTTPQMKDLMSKLGGRTATSMLAVKSDVSIEELEGVSRSLNLGWWLQYLLTRRYQALGVPPVIMGVPEGTNKSTGEVTFQDFTTRLQIIQKQISDAIETQVLWPLAKVNFGEKIEKPRIVWKPIVEEDRNMRAQRLIQARQANTISVNEFRQGIGFERINDPKLDKVTGEPPAPTFNPTGDPRKTKPDKPEKVSQPPPEGVKKKEEASLENQIRVKKIKLLISQNEFKEELTSLVEKAQFELIQGDKTVKQIKTEITKDASSVVDSHISDTYLYGKMDALYSRKSDSDNPITEDDLSITQEDIPEIVKLKKEYVKNFVVILDDMITAKGEGQL